VRGLLEASRLNDLPHHLVLALAVLDLDDPEVGIAGDLAGDVGVGFGLADGRGAGPRLQAGSSPSVLVWVKTVTPASKRLIFSSTVPTSGSPRRTTAAGINARSQRRICALTQSPVVRPMTMGAFMQGADRPVKRGARPLP
jgi:hypothetical protein